MFRVLGLHAVASGSNPVQTSGQDLYPVVPDSTLPRFVNSQLVASCQLGFLGTHDFQEPFLVLVYIHCRELDIFNAHNQLPSDLVAQSVIKPDSWVQFSPWSEFVSVLVWGQFH